jgi:DNA end-binding protein Ku
VIRSKESLVAIRPMGRVLEMSTMLFHDEVIDGESLDETPEDGAKTSQRELNMAKQLIESLASDFEPERYRDEYRERVLDLVERKAQGEEIAVQPPPEEPAKVPDLMAALEASIDAVKARGETGGDGAGRKKAPAGRRRAKASSRGGSKSGSGGQRSRAKARK